MLNSDKLMMDVEEREDGTIVVNIARENHQKLEVNCFTIAGNKVVQRGRIHIEENHGHAHPAASQEVGLGVKVLTTLDRL